MLEASLAVIDDEPGVSVPSTFDDWHSEGVKLAAANKRINWMIGDWLNAGEMKYGDQAKLAAQGIFGLEYQALANIKWVAGKFEPSRRQESVSFSHHAEVAKLAPDQAGALLSRAANEGLSTKDLRKEVLAHKIETGAYTPMVDDDPDARHNSALQGAWNNAPRHVREYWLPLFVESNFGLIDA